MDSHHLSRFDINSEIKIEFKCPIIKELAAQLEGGNPRLVLPVQNLTKCKTWSQSLLLLLSYA